MRKNLLSLFFVTGLCLTILVYLLVSTELLYPRKHVEVITDPSATIVKAQAEFTTIPIPTKQVMVIEEENKPLTFIVSARPIDL